MLKKILLSLSLLITMILTIFLSYSIFTQSDFILNARSKFYDTKINKQHKVITENLKQLQNSLTQVIQSPKIAEIFAKQTIDQTDFPMFAETKLSAIHLTDKNGKILFSSQLFYTGKSIYSNLLTWNTNTEPEFFFSDKDQLVGVAKFIDPTNIDQLNAGYIIAEFPSDVIIDHIPVNQRYVRFINEEKPIFIIDFVNQLTDNMASVIGNHYQEGLPFPTLAATMINIPKLTPFIYYIGNVFYAPPMIIFFILILLIVSVILILLLIRIKHEEIFDKDQMFINKFEDSIISTEQSESVSKLFSDIENGIIYDSEKAIQMMDDAVKFGVINEVEPKNSNDIIEYESEDHQQIVEDLNNVSDITFDDFESLTIGEISDKNLSHQDYSFEKIGDINHFDNTTVIEDLNNSNTPENQKDEINSFILTENFDKDLDLNNESIKTQNLIDNDINDEELSKEQAQENTSGFEDINIIEESEFDLHDEDDNIFLETNEEFDEIPIQEFNELIDNNKNIFNIDSIYETLKPFLDLYKIEFHSIGKLENGECILEIGGHQIILSSNSLVFSDILSQHKVLSMSGNLIDSPYLKDLFPESFIEELGELFIEPILDSEGTVEGIVMLGRNKNLPLLSIEEKRNLFLAMK